MKVQQQIVQLVKRHRWALEEMYIDERLKVANRWYGKPPRVLYRVLANKHGSYRVWGLCEDYLEIVKLPVPQGTSVRGRLKQVGVQYPWLMAELVVESVYRASVKAVKGKTSGIYNYLRTSYSDKEILETLTWIVVALRKRQKTASL